MKKYPFKFLDSYSREDRGIFFGRDEEINALYEMVFQSSILLVYGASGTGKTSLINCGLAGKFQPHDWLALMIRRGNNINDSLEKALNDAGGKTATNANEIDWFDKWSDDTETTAPGLSKIGKSIKAVYQKSFKPVYLIFDQFEELFILGSKTEQKIFIKTIQDILQSEQPIKLIFSIREEYLGHLFEFERAVPQLLQKKLRIEPMNLEKVKQVIIGVADYEDSNVLIQPGESEQLAEGIFKKLKGDKTRTIQLPYLQVFLDKLYINKTGDEDHQSEALLSLDDLNNIGSIDDVLQNFLEEQVMRISRELSSTKNVVTSETIWSILSQFCTLEGTKEPISKKELADRLESKLEKTLLNKSVDEFEKRRILNKSENEDLYELAHDALALKIAEKRSEDDIAKLEVKRLIKSKAALKGDLREDFTEKQLNFIEPYYDDIVSELTEDEKKLYEDSIRARDRKRMREKVLMVVLFSVIVFCLLWIIYLKEVDSMKNKFRVDVKPMENFMESAKSKFDRASFNLVNDPTGALQLDRKALHLLDSAKLKDTFRDKKYGFISRFKEVSRFKETEYNKLDSIYCSTDSLIRAQALSILDKNDAFYNEVEPEKPDNLKDTIINKFAVNRIFPNSAIDSSFKIWNAEKHIIDTIKSHGQLSQVVFPSDFNRAMVMYKDGTAGYLDSLGRYRPVHLDSLGYFSKVKDTSRITSIAPINYKQIRYKMLSALNNNTIVEWNLNGSIRRSPNNQQGIYKPVIYSMKGKDLDDRVVSIAMSPGRTKIFTATDKGIGIIWKADTINVALDSAKTKFDLGQDTVVCSEFSNNGKMIVTGSKDNKVKIWNAGNGYFIKELKGHTGPVTSVAFSANDNIVYTGSLDQTYKQWHLPVTESISEMSTKQWNKLDSSFLKKITDTEPCDSLINKTANKIPEEDK